MSRALIAATVGLCGCASSKNDVSKLPELEAVAQVVLSRYEGTWYEIASFPQRFQKGCSATTATYTARKDGKITVLNRCRKGGVDGDISEARGLAKVVDKETGAKLKVSFFRPFWGAYWIIDLDPDYGYAVVGHPDRNYLWILAREPQLDPRIYDEILTRLEVQHYDTSRLRRTAQPEPPSFQGP